MFQSVYLCSNLFTCVPICLFVFQSVHLCSNLCVSFNLVHLCYTFLGKVFKSVPHMLKKEVLLMCTRFCTRWFFVLLYTRSWVVCVPSLVTSHSEERTWTFISKTWSPPLRTSRETPGTYATCSLQVVTKALQVLLTSHFR